MRLFLILIPVVLAAQTAVAQKAGKCANPSIQWTINPLYVDGTANAVQGDGSSYSGAVQVCSGSFDATMPTARNRTVSFSFARLLASNANTPSWALGGGTYTGQGSFNVRNIFYVPAGTDRNHEYTFTTRLGSTTPAPGSPDFTMTNPSPDAPSSVPNLLLIANLPYNDSLVVAHHCPANTNTSTCPNITHETWFVYPDPNPTASGVGQNGGPITQVGTLLVTTHSGEVNAGEFSMPFFFTISLVN